MAQLMVVWWLPISQDQVDAFSLECNGTSHVKYKRMCLVGMIRWRILEIDTKKSNTLIVKRVSFWR